MPDFRVLLVEDDDTDAADCSRDLQDRMQLPISIVRARSRESAIEAINANLFDIAILDLQIPSADGAFNGRIQHGFEVFARLNERQPGTLTLFVSGQKNDRMIREAVGTRGNADIGFGSRPTVLSFAKHELDGYTAQVRAWVEQLAEIESIPVVDVNGHPSQLSREQERVLRILSRQRQCHNVTIVPLGGLSSSTTLRVVLRDEHGVDSAAFVAKLGPKADVADEAARYRMLVGGLDAGVYAPLAFEVCDGAAGVAGNFYALANDAAISLFEWVRQQPHTAPTALQRLEANTQRWVNARTSRSTTVGAVRRSFVDDLDIAVVGEDATYQRFLALEGETLSLDFVMQHGDLHGENVLIAPDVAPLLIDYGRVGRAPVATDPVVLELSFLFHPDSPFRSSGWPTVEQARGWTDLDSYLLGCPAPDVIRACREWAYRVAPEPVCATIAYANSVRQLRYKDTDHNLAIAIAAAAAAALGY